MPKILITLPEDMLEALQNIAKKEDRVIAAIVRRLVSEYLSKEYGIEIDPSMQRGGYRGGSKDKDEE
jgi:hypothetical protein